MKKTISVLTLVIVICALIFSIISNDRSKNYPRVLYVNFTELNPSTFEKIDNTKVTIFPVNYYTHDLDSIYEDISLFDIPKVQTKYDTRYIIAFFQGEESEELNIIKREYKGMNPYYDETFLNVKDEEGNLFFNFNYGMQSYNGVKEFKKKTLIYFIKTKNGTQVFAQEFIEG